MIHAQLIVGGNQSERLNEAQKIIKKNLGRKINLAQGHPDLLLIEPALSIGIEEVRLLRKKLSLKPYSSAIKVALITQAEKLTLPAQNALLKTLEEPPAKSLVILLAPRADLLLPTVVSRCQLIKLPAKSEIEVSKKVIHYQLSTMNIILKSGAGERIKLAEKLAPNRDQAVEFCHHQLLLWRKMLLVKAASPRKQKPLLGHQQIIATLKAIQSTHQLLEANANPRLAIEVLLLSFPSQKKG